MNLDTFAKEIVREAEIYGNIGTETDEKIAKLEETLGVSPTIKWSKTGTLSLNEEFSVTLSYTYKLPFINMNFNLTSKAVGRSEIYRK